MTFSAIEGNELLKRTLSSMVDSGKIPHAIMLHEDDGGGAFGIAIAFLQYLFCGSAHDGDSCGTCPSCNKVGKLIHPDVHYYFPKSGKAEQYALVSALRELVLGDPFFTSERLDEALGLESKNTLIAVDQAQAILDVLSLSPLERGYRAIVIYLPEKMNREAANRLLKAVEEPPEKTQFILITHAPDKVISTILSRCQCFRVFPEGAGVGAKGSEEQRQLLDELMDALVSHNLLSALEVGEKLSALPTRENAKAFCKFATSAARDIFTIQQGVPDLSKGVDPDCAAWAAACRKTFPRTALEAFSRAVSLIERNVNMKIIFTDMVNRLFVSV